MNTRTRLADLALIGVSLLWGAGFIAVQAALASGMPASLIVAVRFVIGALAVLAVRPKTVAAIKGGEWGIGITAGVLLYFSFFTQTLGQARSGISNAAFITAVYVVLVPFIIWAFRGKPPKLKMFFLVFTTLAGVFILTFRQGSRIFSFTAGDILLLLCALGFAAHIAYLGLKAKAIDPVKITFLQLAVSGVLGSAFFLAGDVSAVFRVDWSVGLPAVLYLGVVSSAVCYFLQTWAQTITSPSKAAIMMSMESVFGSVFSILLGMEAYRIGIPIGGAVILASVVLSELEWRSRRQRRLNPADLGTAERE